MGDAHAMEALKADAVAKLANFEGGAKKRMRAEATAGDKGECSR